MRHPAMKTLAGLRASHGTVLGRSMPSRFSISLSLSSRPSTPSRSYSSLLRPLTATFHPIHSSNAAPTTSKRPAPRLRSHPHSRAFSVLPVLDTAVSAAQSALTTLHATAGLPWYAAIPLFAAALGLATRLGPTVYARRAAVRRQHLVPLQRAWAMRARAGAAATAAGPTGATTVAAQRQQVLELQRSHRRVVREMEKRWGVQGWKDFVPSLAVFPFWLVGIEALRRLCGGPRGWLGSLLFGSKAAAEVPEAGWGDGAGALAAGQAQGPGEVAASYVADPSMVTGGCLWFPDLTAADPYHILPFALSAIMVVNMVPRTRETWRVLLGVDGSTGERAAGMQWRLRLQRGLLLVALAIGPITMNLPAALHLYWISSATMTWAQTNVIWRTMPLPKTVGPAKTEFAGVKPTREVPQSP